MFIMTFFSPTEPGFWIALGLLLLILEVLNGEFVLFSLGIGCLLTSLFVFLGLEDISLIVGICTFNQILVLLLIRPIAIRSFHVNTTPTNTDAIIGQIAVVTKPISGQFEPGYVRFQGENEEWRAVSADNESTFEVDAPVVVESLSGITVTVTRAPAD